MIIYNKTPIFQNYVGSFLNLAVSCLKKTDIMHDWEYDTDAEPVRTYE